MLYAIALLVAFIIVSIAHRACQKDGDQLAQTITKYLMVACAVNFFLLTVVFFDEAKVALRYQVDNYPVTLVSVCHKTMHDSMAACMADSVGFYVGGIF